MSDIKQVMNVLNSCNRKNFFIDASLNGTFHLSPHENILTITHKRYLYAIKSNYQTSNTSKFLCGSWYQVRASKHTLIGHFYIHFA